MDKCFSHLRSDEVMDTTDMTQVEECSFHGRCNVGLRERVVSNITPRFLAEADVVISSSPICMLGDGGWG